MSFTKNDIQNFFKVSMKEDTINPTNIEKEVEIMETIPEDNSLNPKENNAEGEIELEVDTELEAEIQNLDIDSSVDSKMEAETEENNNLDNNNLEDKSNIPPLDLEDIPDNKDLDKIELRQQQKIKQINLLLQIFKLLKFHTDRLEDLTNLTFPRETLIQKDNKEKLLELIPQLKEVYNSSYLTCLHDNSIYKQKFPAVNLVRQVLKCHHLALTPKIMSNGYEKTTGKKKVSRIFKIEKQMF